MTSRVEPKTFDSSQYHEDCISILRDIQWLPFLEKFRGSNEEVAKQFAFTFNGEKALIGTFSFRVSEDTIAQATGVSPEGEKYFKTKQFKEKSWTQFMSRSRVSAVNWKKGVPRSWLVHPWDEMVYILQKFVTCEGRYSIVYLYHIKLLLHIKKQCTISLPYFLLQSLTKMSKTVQKQKGNEDKSLYHFGLIRILIEDEMQRRGKTWKEFLTANQIRDEEEREKSPENSGFVRDVDEDIPASSRAHKVPVSTVRTRQMRKEEAKRAEKDKVFTTYSRRSRRAAKVQLQEESNVPVQMDIQSSGYSPPAPEADVHVESHSPPGFDIEVESHNKPEKGSPPPGKKQRKLERQIEKLKEELMEANMLERVIKKENQMLRTQTKEIQMKNDKLKERVSELEAEQTDICKWATKWYSQKKTLKEKYRRLKQELHDQEDVQVKKKNVDTLLKAAEVQTGTEFKGSTSGLA